MKRTIKIALAFVVGVIVLPTALIGFAHTKAGRPLRGLLGMAPKGMCPLGYDVAKTDLEKEAARRNFAAQHKGTAHAALRPALGFALDRTTRSDVLAWAEMNHVACAAPKRGPDLDCKNVPARALPERFGDLGLQNVWFAFGAGDRLTTVIAVRRDPSAKAIGGAFQQIAVEVTKQAGPPSESKGEGTRAELERGVLAQASVEYRFRDYYALARATNLGDGFVLTEEYCALPN